MKKTWAALGASALAVALVASTIDSAEARRGGGFGGFRGGGHYAARSFAPRAFATGPRFIAPRRIYGHHRHFRRGVVIGAPLAYGAYYYGYGYGSGCGWLRHRALETGSRYWWSRYYDCINGYY